MGTYMDAFIEIDHSDKSPAFCDPMQIWSLTEGSLSLGKDYEVFDALGYGRESQMAPDEQDPTLMPKFPPRGMPIPQSSAVAQHFFRLVTDSDNPPNEYFWPLHRCVSPVEANKWVLECDCMASEFLQWVNTGSVESIMWPIVAEPHYYNASWLSPIEYETALKHQRLSFDTIPVEYSIIRSAMAHLVQRYGSDRVRLVFWFS